MNCQLGQVIFKEPEERNDLAVQQDISQVTVSERMRTRQFPLLLSVKVLPLSPKQPHAPSNNHALSSSVQI